MVTLFIYIHSLPNSLHIHLARLLINQHRTAHTHRHHKYASTNSQLYSPGHKKNDRWRSAFATLPNRRTAPMPMIVHRRAHRSRGGAIKTMPPPVRRFVVNQMQSPYANVAPHVSIFNTTYYSIFGIMTARCYKYAFYGTRHKRTSCACMRAHWRIT